MFEGNERAWGFYLDDMIEFAQKVLGYSAGLEQHDFVANELVYDAILRNLELIGEAATTFRTRCVMRIHRFRGGWLLQHAIA